MNIAAYNAKRIAAWVDILNRLLVSVDFIVGTPDQKTAVIQEAFFRQYAAGA